MMDIGDPAGHGILNRDHAEVGFARGDRGQRVLEGRAGQRLDVRIGLDDGDMGIGARLALECDFQLLVMSLSLAGLLAAAEALARCLG